MIEPILLTEENEKRTFQKKSSSTKFQWVMFIAFSIVLAGGIIALVMHFDQPEGSSSNDAPPVLTSPQSAELCGACTLIPHMEDHVMCKSCKWNRAESKSLLCPAGYGNMEFQKVKLGGKMNSEALAALQEECTKQFHHRQYQDVAGDFACSFTLDTLLPGTEPTEPESTTSSPTLERRRPRRAATDEGSVKAEYTCHKLGDDTFNYEENLPVRLSSALLSEPFLSSIQVKCNKRKQLADTVEMAKICAASGEGNFEFSCPSGADPRVIVLKMKQLEPVTTGTKSDKKANKKRAQMLTNYCAAGNMNGASCSVPAENILLDTEDNLVGFSWDVKYMCSYSDIAGTLFLSKSLEQTGYLSEQPGEVILHSALVKCGNRKAYSSTVEVAKVCSDQEFELSCDSSADPRIIVLSMWEGDRSAKSNQDAKKRASLATDVCTGSKFEDGTCLFTLDDVLFEEEINDPSLTVDTTYTVKYLCSYNAPIINF